MEILEAETFEEIKAYLNHQGTILFYLYHDDCGMCKALGKKLENALSRHTTLIFMYIHIQKIPKAQGLFMAFSAPDCLLYQDGKNTLRKAGIFVLEDVVETIEKLFQFYEGVCKESNKGIY